MVLGWEEIKKRAIAFSKDFENETSEQAEAQTFWNYFFEIFGRKRRRVASFEKKVTTNIRKNGRIDLLWKGHMLIEHKSFGSDLDKAHKQAIDYFPGLKDSELPKLIVVCDFQNFCVYDLDEEKEYKFKLNDLHQYVELFGFIAGYQKQVIKEEDPVNVKAAEMMGLLYDELKETGYDEKQLEIFLVRLLFCFFADDTNIFNKHIFENFIELKTNEDGSDLGSRLNHLFELLNTPRDKRQSSLPEDLSEFPYVNGKLFEENIRTISFNSKLRELILDCSSLDWGKTSPAVFGSMFQSVMDPEKRKDLGAHYTSEKNILKLIKPLFLDELEAEFKKVQNSRALLVEFHKKLGTLKFLDPACGCGNFLIVTYREIRLLENKVLEKLYGQQQVIGIDTIIKVGLEQFYGIEIEGFSSKIAEVAMWLVDHQMNLITGKKFGEYFVRLPLKKSSTIVHENALKIDWSTVIPKDEVSYVIGNPPFIGHHYQNKEQKEDLKLTLKGVKASGVLDYVSAWYFIAAKFILNTRIKTAFVSTNSIAQGEQVGILWQSLINRFNVKIHFAHRTFNWSNDAKGNAAVHVVIIGFANFDIKNKKIFTYRDIKGEPDEIRAKNVNPYLIDAPDTVITNRSSPICDVPNMKYGSKPTDGGHFILNEEEKNQLISLNPKNATVIKNFLSAREFLNNGKRWCIWLENISPETLKELPDILNRVAMVKKFRSESIAKSTREYPYHTLFRQITQPKSDFILVPRVSSERRRYIPFGFFSQENIVSDSCQAIPNGGLFHFGILTSLMHMSWVKYTCGRLKSDYRYSKDIVYNNYPWPMNPSDKNKKKVEEKAQKILDVRAEFPDSSLADLYHQLTMPPKLAKAHLELDKAVDLCYRPQKFITEIARVEFLFDLYKEYISPLFSEKRR
jgi:hypothetical protein